MLSNVIWIKSWVGCPILRGLNDFVEIIARPNLFAFDILRKPIGIRLMPSYQFLGFVQYRLFNNSDF